MVHFSGTVPEKARVLKLRPILLPLAHLLPAGLQLKPPSLCTRLTPDAQKIKVLVMD